MIRAAQSDLAGGLFENRGEIIGFLGRRPFGDKTGRILTQFPQDHVIEDLGERHQVLGEVDLIEVSAHRRATFGGDMR